MIKRQGQAEARRRESNCQHAPFFTQKNSVLSQKIRVKAKILAIKSTGGKNMISFKWGYFKKNIILMLVWWYLAYSLSYRDIEELALERGLKVDHSTINRWVIYYSPQLEEAFRKRYKSPVGISWRMDETYNLHLALLFMLGGLFVQLTVRQIKYLNNIVEQDHRFIKKITKPMKGFKTFHSADATLAGIELHHMLKKG